MAQDARQEQSTKRRSLRLILIVTKQRLTVWNTRCREPFLADGIFTSAKRLGADDLSRCQPKKEQYHDGRLRMYGANNSSVYYRNREQAERALADKAASTAIRDIHLEMAERYRALAEALEMQPRSHSLA